MTTPPIGSNPPVMKPNTSSDARQKILNALNSHDTIGALLTPAQNSYRLSIRDALAAGRTSRFKNFKGGTIRRPGTSATPPEDDRGDEQHYVDPKDPFNDPGKVIDGETGDNQGFLEDRNAYNNQPTNPNENETFQQYWKRVLGDTYNSTEVEKLFGQKDIGSLAALDVAEKTPWLVKAMSWLSGVPGLGWILGKGYEWALGKYFDSKVWMNPTDPQNPYRSDSDISRDLNRLFNQDQFLPNSNNNYSTKPVGDYDTGVGDDTFTGGGSNNTRDGLLNPDNRMPGSEGPADPSWNDRVAAGAWTGSSITAGGYYNFATRLKAPNPYSGSQG